MADCISYKLKGIGLGDGCKAGVGGILSLYLIDAANVNVTFPEIPESGEVDGTLEIEDITLNGANKFKEFKFNPNTGSMTSTFETDETRSYNVFTTEVALQFMGLDSSKRMQIMAMCLNQVVAVVKDANKNYWLLGDPNGNIVQASAATAVTGVGAREFNGYTVTLKTESTELPYRLSATAQAKFETGTGSIVDSGSDN